MCWRTSQSKISAPPPVSDSRPASISSSRISSAGRPLIFSNHCTSVAVKHLSLTFGSAAFSSRSTLRVVPPGQRRVQAVDDVQLGELLVLHLLGLADRLVDAHRVRVLLARLALERAVRAAGRADVGQVEVPVDVEHHPVAVHLGAPVVRQPAEPGQIVAGVQRVAVRAGQPLARVDLCLELTLQSGIHVRPSPDPGVESTSRLRQERSPHGGGRRRSRTADLGFSGSSSSPINRQRCTSWGMTFMGDGQRRVATDADRERMATHRQLGRAERVGPWWRPLAYSAAAARRDRRSLPTPARLRPRPGPRRLRLPRPSRDAGRGRMPLGTLVMPGQKTARRPRTATVAVATGVATSPLLTKIEKRPRRDRRTRRPAHQAR